MFLVVQALHDAACCIVLRASRQSSCSGCGISVSCFENWEHHVELLIDMRIECKCCWQHRFCPTHTLLN